MKQELREELEIMEAYQLLSAKQKGGNPYQTPKGYFEEKQRQLNQITHSHFYQVPSDYFDSLTDKVMARIDEEETPLAMHPDLEKSKKPIIRSLVPFLSMAAAITLFFGVFLFMQNQSSQSQFTAIQFELFTEEELVFLNDDAETFVLEALYDDFSGNSESQQLLDPLFEEKEASFDSLFSL